MSASPPAAVVVSPASGVASSSRTTHLLAHAATATVSALGAATVTWLLLRRRLSRAARWEAEERDRARMLAEADAQSHAQHGLTPSQFNKAARDMIDEITMYRATLRTRPVRSQAQPDYLSSLVPAQAPEDGESWSSIHADIERVIMPGITHWSSPRFFSYFPAYASYPSLLGEMMCSALNTIGFSWIGSPASTELELRCMDWLGQLLNLPNQFLHQANLGGGGVLQGTAAEAAAVSMLAARAHALEVLLGAGSSDEAAQDAASSKFVAYISEHTHGIIAKGAKITGLPPASRLRTLRAGGDTNFALTLPVVQQAMTDDVARGLHPYFLTLTIGTTSSTAIDEVEQIARWVRQHHPAVWVHVDAAYAGSFAMLPSHAHLFRGLEFVNSFSFNPHKSLLVAFDCSCLFVAARAPLLRALSLTTNEAYLRNEHSAAGRVIDLKDWQLPFGRRFRSLKLWFTLRSYGARGLRRHLQSAIENADRFRAHIAASKGRFKLCCEPCHFGLVCFQLVLPQDLLPESTSAARRNECNERLKEMCNATGDIFFVTTVLDGETVLRLACNGESQQGLGDVDAAWAVIEKQTDILFQEEGWTNEAAAQSTTPEQ